MLELEFIESPDQEMIGKHTSFRHQLIIGSGKNADIIIADPEIKSKHMRLRMEGEGLLGSGLSGAFFHLEGKKILENWPVGLNQLIKIGNTSFKITQLAIEKSIDYRQELKARYEKISNDRPDLAMVLKQMERELLRLQSLENIRIKTDK